MKLNFTKDTAISILYTIAGILLIIWAIGYYRYEAGSSIHILLVIAAIAVLLRIILEKKITK